MTVTNAIKSVIFHSFFFPEIFIRFLDWSRNALLKHIMKPIRAMGWTQKTFKKRSNTHFVWIIRAFNSVSSSNLLFNKFSSCCCCCFLFFIRARNVHVTFGFYCDTFGQCKHKNQSYWCLNSVQRKNTNGKSNTFSVLNVFFFFWLFCGGVGG